MSKNLINETRDFYNIMRKSMLREQDNEQVADDASQTSSQSKVTFTKDDSILQNFITDINNVVTDVHITFQELDFFQSDSKVQWTGTITDNNVDWTAIYSPSDTGVYFDMSNSNLTINDTLAIHKLNTYLQKTWFSAIKNALQKNELKK
jgi:hypothetical protein